MPGRCTGTRVCPTRDAGPCHDPNPCTPQACAPGPRALARAAHACPRPPRPPWGVPDPSGVLRRPLVAHSSKDPTPPGPPFGPPPAPLSDASDAQINSHPRQDTARRRQITAAAPQPQHLIFLVELHNKKSMADAVLLMRLRRDGWRWVVENPLPPHYPPSSQVPPPTPRSSRAQSRRPVLSRTPPPFPWLPQGSLHPCALGAFGAVSNARG